ncbi:MAG: molecular chaperone DnaJ [Novosphingobium sp.]|uniref:molecular chaperone DnaJ n=1 Tax=Novosphingobium sp. TaxID=1874826 RepID=UPI00391C3486|nr:molecular chaperone DnaJ [Novosphingobium sp.]
MIKVIALVLLAVLACRVLTRRWPWELWAISERSQAEAQARALLGVDRSARRAAIIEAHRRLIAQVHPDRGGSNDAVHAANAARDLLLARLERTEAE